METSILLVETSRESISKIWFLMIYTSVAVIDVLGSPAQRVRIVKDIDEV